MGENKEKGKEKPKLPKEPPIETIRVKAFKEKKGKFTGEQKKNIK